jgi:hypothetical protein
MSRNASHGRPVASRRVGFGRQRRHRRASARSAFERLEGRALLAITGLPGAGSQGGAPIVLSADTVDAENTLTIVLDDTTTPGFVTATIDDGVSSVQVWDFGDSITFVGTTDTDGSVTNVVNFTTPYETALEGFGVFGGPLTPTEWNAWGRFGVSPTPLADIQVTLLYADELFAEAGSLGGPASTIAGDFQSPTAPAVGGSVVALTSAVGISDALNVGIGAYELTLAASNGAVAIDASIATTSDLLVSAVNAPLTLGGGARTVTSTAGDITIRNTVGPIALDNTAVTASSGFVTVETPNTLSVTNASSFTAPLAYDVATSAGLVHLEGLLGLVLPVTLPITAGRLELVTNSAAPVQLLSTSVASLQTDIQGDLSFASDVPLAITDFDAATPSVQVTARNVTIQAEAGLRVVDGIDAAGTLCLTTWSGAGVPTVPVEFVVTSTSDNPLASAAFAGTLRDMVEYANANTLFPAAITAGVTVQPMRILFDEPGSPVAGAGTVTLQEALPALARAVTIDGTLPDGTFVAISGGNTVSNGVTLGTGSSGSTVSNATFHAFANAGVRVESADNLLTGLILGETVSGGGPLASPNAIGIELYGPQAVRNTVGIRTLGVDVGNRIVANSIAGVMVRAGANYNTIVGNVIGAIDAGFGNFDGIAVLNSIGTTIGGTQTALANTIFGNARHGIRLTNVNGVAPAYGTLVIGNSIAANSVSGVTIEAGSRNVVGGFTAASANTITGNGVGVQMVSRGIVATKGNGVYGNAITNNTFGGVSIDQGYANLVQGNTITDSSEGTSSWGVRIYRSTVGVGVAANQVFQNLVSGHGDADPDVAPLTGGIVVENASGQVIGGMGTLANTVTSNRGSGVVVIGGVGVNGSSRNLINGNYVGTNSLGESLGNAYDGIRLQGAVATTVRANTVRGTRGLESPAAVGISVHNALPASAALGNVVVSNSVSGNGTGLLVSGSRSTVVGGAVSGLGNWVFGNQANGIEVRNSDATGASSGTVIRNNQIGLATRTTAAGNGGYGIDLQSTVGTIIDTGNTIANNTAGGIRVEGGRVISVGSAAGLGNAIWGNGGDGVEVLEPATALARTEVVTVAGNAIRDNAGYGVSVAGGRVSGITIGRAVPVNRPTAAANSIVGNVSGGVLVDAAQAVSIVGNSIASNGGLGIELLNGANTGVTAPLLTSAVPRVVGQKSPQYDVRGSVFRTGDGTQPQTCLVDIYGTNTATSRQVFLGRVVVTIREGANAASFRLIVGAIGAAFNQIVATATLGAGTSEFSSPVNV